MLHYLNLLVCPQAGVRIPPVQYLNVTIWGELLVSFDTCEHLMALQLASICRLLPYRLADTWILLLSGKQERYDVA